MGTYKYIYLKLSRYKRGDYSLIPIRRHDIYKIKDWRNAQIDVLRQKELLTDDDQKKYFNEVIEPSFWEKKPKQILFSYLYKNKCVGYGGFVHISWQKKKAEVSFLVDDKRAKKEKIYQQDFTNYLELIKKIAFSKIGFDKITVETYSFRKKHVAILEKTGFELKRVIKETGLVKGKYFDSLLQEIVNDKKHA